jgi:hypothetical protein
LPALIENRYSIIPQQTLSEMVHGSVLYAYERAVHY